MVQTPAAYPEHVRHCGFVSPKKYTKKPTPTPPAPAPNVYARSYGYSLRHSSPVHHNYDTRTTSPSRYRESCSRSSSASAPAFTQRDNYHHSPAVAAVPLPATLPDPFPLFNSPSPPRHERATSTLTPVADENGVEEDDGNRSQQPTTFQQRSTRTQGPTNYGPPKPAGSLTKKSNGGSKRGGRGGGHGGHLKRKLFSPSPPLSDLSLSSGLESDLDSDSSVIIVKAGKHNVPPRHNHTTSSSSSHPSLPSIPPQAAAPSSQVPPPIAPQPPQSQSQTQTQQEPPPWPEAERLQPDRRNAPQMWFQWNEWRNSEVMDAGWAPNSGLQLQELIIRDMPPLDLLRAFEITLEVAETRARQTVARLIPLLYYIFPHPTCPLPIFTEGVPPATQLRRANLLYHPDQLNGTSPHYQLYASLVILLLNKVKDDLE